jgi:YVTN family beta-propeller protein
MLEELRCLPLAKQAGGRHATLGRRVRGGLPLGTILVAVALGQFPGVAAADSAYVANSTSGTVSVIDTKTHEVTATIPVGASPWHPTCTPNGRQVYVSSSGDNAIYGIDVKSNEVTSTIDLSGLGLPGHPYGLAFTRDGKRLFVTVHDITNLRVGYFVVITLATGEVSQPVVLPGGLSEKIVMAPNGKRAYTQRIDVIDVEAQYVIATIPGGAASTILMSPNSKELYGTDLRNNAVVVVDTESLSVTNRIPIGVGPNGLALSRDFKSLFVASFFSKTLQVIDIKTGEVSPPVPVPSNTGPGFMEITKDGKELYIVHPAFPDPLSNVVSVFDTKTLQEVDTIEVGVGPSMVAICKSTF